MTKSLPPKSLVLYADDDADDHELIRDAFEEFSSLIDLVSFNDGQALLRYLQSRTPLQPSPCLIILDINMPIVDGKHALKQLRAMANYKEVPVVLFSTSTLPSEAAYAKSYGAGFITKPLHARQVHTIVNQLLEHCTEEVKDKIKKHRDK